MTPNWKNHTIWTGDNLPIMRGLNSESVDLIYLDPPFNSNQDYAAPIGSKAAGAAFKDTWTLDDVDRLWLLLLRDKNPLLFHVIEGARLVHGNGMASYLSMMAQRLDEMKRLLKPAGSIYLHCDPTASHYLKLLMDAVFGAAHYRNEISWRRSNPKSLSTVNFPNCRDIILRYSKSGGCTFNKVFGEHDPEYVRRAYKYTDPDGRRYRLLPLLNPNNDRPNLTYEFLGITRVWRWTRERMEQAYRDGIVVQLKSGSVPQYKKYLDESKGRTVTNDWGDIEQAAGNEATGYPTQKPLALLERIVKASSNPGGVVLDPFAGCATACVAAERHGRQWLGIDISEKAAELVQVRIRKEIDLFHDFKPIHRTDQPQRTDLGKLSPPSAHKDVLYGKQSGQCGGCLVMFHKRNLTLDHIVPGAYGGTDHIENLWLLCGACNSSKGTKSQAEFLKERVKRGESIEWFIN